VSCSTATMPVPEAANRIGPHGAATDVVTMEPGTVGG
jgi:hypothetical protein